jgi:hypothetical protein
MEKLETSAVMHTLSNAKTPDETYEREELEALADRPSLEEPSKPEAHFQFDKQDDTAEKPALAIQNQPEETHDALQPTSKRIAHQKASVSASDEPAISNDSHVAETETNDPHKKVGMPSETCASARQGDDDVLLDDSYNSNDLDQLNKENHNGGDHDEGNNDEGEFTNEKSDSIDEGQSNCTTGATSEEDELRGLATVLAGLPSSLPADARHKHPESMEGVKISHTSDKVAE